jgi:gas vesicle protein
LVELMIGASLGAIILAGTLTVFLFLGRSGANLRNYNDMESQARKSLELFAEDTRQASSVVWASVESVTLIVNAQNIVYTYTSGSFTRQTPSGTTTLLTGITEFGFSAYDINGTSVVTKTSDLTSAANRTAANNATKQVQISLSASRTAKTVTTATNIVLSARYVLRNKKVTA